MRFKILLTAALACSLIISCGSKDKKETGQPENKETTVKAADDGMVPAIDTATLKDEASILDAMQKVVDARLADEKKQKDEPGYAGHYLELTRLYTAVLKASTEYSKTLTDPNQAVEFNNKVSAIQQKMYGQ